MTALIIDPVFPQIQKILEPGFMREIFQNALDNQDGHGREKLLIEKCEVGEKRYKPGKSFMLSYKLRVQKPASKTSFEQIVAARLCPADGVGFEIEDGFKNREHPPVGLAPLSYLRDVGMMLWAFPNDPKLTHLPKLLETARLCTFFNGIAANLNLSPTEHVFSADAEIVHYLPGQSCMIRYKLSVLGFADGDKPTSREMVVYGKNYCDGRGAETYDVMAQIAAQSSRCAKPLYYDIETNTLWQSHLSGKPFEWTANRAQNVGDIGKAAACIAEFHRCQVNSSAKYGFPEINRNLTATVKLAGCWDAALGDRVKGTVKALLDLQAQLDWAKTGPGSPIHLDLKMGNLLISADKACLIDMDCVSLGDPLADTGSFIANLYLNGLRFGSSVREVDHVAAIFIEAYCDAMDREIDTSKLHWFISAALIHEVLRRSLRQQDQGRIRQMGHYISVSHRYLALCRGYPK